MQWWEYHPCQLGIWHPGWAQRSPRCLSPGHGDTWPTTEGRNSRDASSLPGSVSVSVPNSWPLTLAARCGLSSHGGGQHAPCRSGFPAASQPGSLMGLKATSSKQISESVRSQQTAHPLTILGGSFCCCTRRVTLSPDLGPLGLSVTLMITAAKALLIRIWSLW